MFNLEKEEKFRERVMQCKQLQQNAENEIRFAKYVYSVDRKKITNMSKGQMDRITEKSKCNIKKKSKQTEEVNEK